VPGLSNAWITSGHYRTGILLAPAAGAALAGWITTQRRPGNLQPWGMARSSMTMVRPGGAASEGRV
jgi:glycine/D-amino acid oxidase-like deaminating enzyme